MTVEEVQLHLSSPNRFAPEKGLLSTEHDTKGQSRTSKIRKTDKSLALIIGIQTQD
jgi:hypothetical protein